MRFGIVLLGFAVAAAGCSGPMHNRMAMDRCGGGGGYGAESGPPMGGPGVDGPGPGVIMHGPGMSVPSAPSQVAFVGPEGMLVSWDVAGPGQFDSEPLVCPGRHNFTQGAIYQLKLMNVPGRPGVELYPTLEVGPSMPRTQAFLAHNAMPVQMTDEDFDQVLSGNFVTKVIYLPDPEYQELALAGVETLVSTRLDPGVDPIVEADRRGSIMGVLRLGNKDLEMPGGDVQAAAVLPASFSMRGPNGGMAPMPPNGPMNAPMNGAGWVPSNYISGVTGPQYGTPMSGTPIGLVGPPHIPLGRPAGLQRHTMVNRTGMNPPRPTRRVRTNTRQMTFGNQSGAMVGNTSGDNCRKCP